MQPINTNNNGLLSIQTSRLHETLFEKEDSTPHMLKIRSAKIRDKFSFLMLCSSYSFWILFQCVPTSLRFIIKQLGCLLRYYFDSWHLAFQSEFVIFCNSIKRATKLLKTISFQRRNYPVRSADNRLEYQPSHFFEHFHCLFVYLEFFLKNLLFVLKKMKYC